MIVPHVSLLGRYKSLQMLLLALIISHACSYVNTVLISFQGCYFNIEAE